MRNANVTNSGLQKRPLKTEGQQGTQPFHSPFVQDIVFEIKVLFRIIY